MQTIKVFDLQDFKQSLFIVCTAIPGHVFRFFLIKLNKVSEIRWLYESLDPAQPFPYSLDIWESSCKFAKTGSGNKLIISKEKFL